MNLVRPLSVSLGFVFLCAPLGAQPDPHKGHHPAGSAPAAAKAVPAKTTPEMAQMAHQKQAMQDMHTKMMAAKTPEERGALMAEHMKTMQDGMGMMKGMGDAAGRKDRPSDMTQRQSMMEQRMDMMQTMMEMMVDRLAPTPAKP